MARCSSAGRGVTNLPTATAGPGLFAVASHRLRLREVGVFNTTTTAFVVGLQRCTATGTQAGSLTETCDDDPVYTPIGNTFTSMSTAATTSGAPSRQASVGAAIGAGVIWTFGDNGLVIPEGTANGVILNLPTGTGQFFDFYLVWDE